LQVSLAEGFGLPALESLALGVPVIVAADIPSVAMIEPLGQCRIAAANTESIREAVLSLLDDEVHRRKCEEIPRLALPRWADFGGRLAAWVEAQLGSAKRKAS
jgi:glycosyltransferase involved in cell wall biosynthesis